MAKRVKRAVTIHGFPNVRSLADLESYTGVSTRQLWLMLFRSRSSYCVFPLRKKSGGYRIIAHPKSALKFVQRWILRNILDRLSTTESCYGFDRGSKLVDHAGAHIDAKAMLSIDIENFFPSVGVARVTAVFRLAGYSSTGASLLARLCTFHGVLPQGAPSSPKLANLVCYRMDRRLAALTRSAGIVYTRYADDMSFSGPTASVLSKTRPLITHIVNDSGFRLNAAKSRLAGPSRALKVTGLVLSGGTVGIGRQRLREFRVRIHHLHTGVSAFGVKSVQGLLDYVADVDPARYTMLVDYIQGLLRKNSGTALEDLRVRSEAS